MNDVHVPCVCEDGLKYRDQVGVDFNSSNFFGAGGEYKGQIAESGADFKHAVSLIDLRNLDDFLQGFLIGQEILSEAFPWSDLVLF